MKTEILTWEDKNLHQIPLGDNPLYDFKDNDPMNGRKQDCIMICKPFERYIGDFGESAYCVIYIPMEGNYLYKGMFYALHDAEIFAKALAEIISPKPKS